MTPEEERMATQIAELPPEVRVKVVEDLLGVNSDKAKIARVMYVASQYADTTWGKEFARAIYQALALRKENK